MLFIVKQSTFFEIAMLVNVAFIFLYSIYFIVFHTYHHTFFLNLSVQITLAFPCKVQLLKQITSILIRIFLLVFVYFGCQNQRLQICLLPCSFECVKKLYLECNVNIFIFCVLILCVPFIFYRDLYCTLNRNSMCIVARIFKSYLTGTFLFSHTCLCG